MSVGTLILLIIALCVVGYYVGIWRAAQVRKESGGRLKASRGYFGFYVALWCGIPSLLLVLAWLLLEPVIVESLIVSSLPDTMTADLSSERLSLIRNEIENIARGQIFGDPDPVMLAAAERYNTYLSISNAAMIVAGLSLAIGATVLSRRRLSGNFQVRDRVEGITTVIMIVCSVIAILTTVGIVTSLLLESLRFFEQVPLQDFLFGMNWEPQMPIRADQVAATGAFGAIPVFAGTFLISFIAMVIAVPIGLLTAIYLAEYGGRHLRDTVKPIIEILAGIPTVVYGFFAVLTVAPALRDFGASAGLDVAANSALAAGAVMGLMLIPFISSLSDDAINAVPQSLRDGASALGATKRETIIQVVLPAALPGIVGAFLLAISRAIGETMIVVMAAGLIANMTANPFEAVTTVTVQIVTLLIGDSSFDDPKTLSAFALGLVLFLMTLALNIIALRVTQKYREKYE